MTKQKVYGEKTESIQWEIHKNELKLLAGMKVIEFGFQWRKKNTDYKGESFQWMKLKRIFSSSFLDRKKNSLKLQSDSGKKVVNKNIYQWIEWAKKVKEIQCSLFR